MTAIDNRQGTRTLNQTVMMAGAVPAGGGGTGDGPSAAGAAATAASDQPRKPS